MRVFFHLFCWSFLLLVSACSNEPTYETISGIVDHKWVDGNAVYAKGQILFSNSSFWEFQGVKTKAPTEFSDTLIVTGGDSAYYSLLTLYEDSCRLYFVSIFNDTLNYDIVVNRDTPVVIPFIDDYYKIYEHYPFVGLGKPQDDIYPQPDFRKALDQFGSFSIILTSSGCFHLNEIRRIFTLHEGYLIEQTDTLSGYNLNWDGKDWDWSDTSKHLVVLPLSYVDTLQKVQQQLFDFAKESSSFVLDTLENGEVRFLSDILMSTTNYLCYIRIGREVHKVRGGFTLNFDYREHNVQAKLVDGWESLNSN